MLPILRWVLPPQLKFFGNTLRNIPICLLDDSKSSPTDSEDQPSQLVNTILVNGHYFHFKLLSHTESLLQLLAEDSISETTQKQRLMTDWFPLTLLYNKYHAFYSPSYHKDIVNVFLKA